MSIRVAIIAAGMLFATPLLAEVIVGDPYVRAVPPGQPNSAAFMMLSNDGAADRALTGASSTAAEVVELHTHTMVDGMMRMRRIERIQLPAGKARVLEPGGLHLMLIGLTRDLAPGDKVALTLRFDDGSEVQLEAPVRPIVSMQGPDRT